MASVTAATTTKSPTAVAVSPFNLQTCTALVSSVMYRSLANEYAIACAEDVPELTSGQPNQALTRLGKSPITDATVAKMLATNACRMWTNCGNK
ncbi:hypothetical protein H310_05160 [Aphanomyces invadans]|uniref:Uncharacterized protein n=1 Tax=Aphanomyces invadans TaxID=157072 RepID=A0A024UBY7_9STRA|nr:hypothetical protein H310_05160 [Aphanomyces invadans]ETW03794.1 hypothetical protein H310_05160 [Aphanomyces invadans]|eukprot:XP_008868023.1 hypothetical protein H310_05160 [Aphanomyces invadans]